MGATWVMTRLVDPLFVDRSLRGYQLAAGLALGGIALAFALTAGLARTVRRQADERDRLQTELRRSERLAALGKLLAGVAHEVRNPLAGIRSTAQLWQRGVVGLDEESLGGLVHEVDRLEEIVSRLLQFSRADAQDLVPGDLNAVLAEAARLAAGPGRGQGRARRGRPRPGSPAGGDGRPGPAAGLPQPDDQRRPGDADRRDPPPVDAARPSRQRRSRPAWPTPARGWRPRRWNMCSSRSTRPRPRGPGWDWPSPARSRWPTGASSVRPTGTDGTGAVFTLVLPAAASENNGAPTHEHACQDPGGRR